MAGWGCNRHATLSGPNSPASTSGWYEPAPGEALSAQRSCSSTVTVRITSPTVTAVATSMPSVTYPKRLYDLASFEVQSSMHTKNCEPLVSGPALAIATAPNVYSPRTGSSANLYPGPPAPLPWGQPPSTTHAGTARLSVRPS